MSKRLSWMSPTVLRAFQDVRDGIKENSTDYANIIQRVSRRHFLRPDEIEILIRNISSELDDTKARRIRIEKRLNRLKKTLEENPLSDIRKMVRS
jgi:hypothetical protein